MKLKTTYANTLPVLARRHPSGTCWCGLKHWAETWRVHTTILDTRTETGRLATKSPNLQNIPSRTALGRQLRQGFIASPGTRLAGADYSQEELRLAAHYSQDESLIRIFQSGVDPHNETAKKAFHTETPDYVTQRTPARNINYGALYGLSGPGMFDLMAVTYATAQIAMPDWLTIGWCEAFIKQWFEIYPRMKDYISEQEYRARRYGIVWSLFGRVRKVPEVQSALPHIRSAGLRQAANTPIQATGADWMRLTMGEVDSILEDLRSKGVWAWPLLSIHDELIAEVEEDWTETVSEMIAATMRSVMTDRDTGEHQFRVPIEADCKVMERWTKG